MLLSQVFIADKANITDNKESVERNVYVISSEV